MTALKRNPAADEIQGPAVIIQAWPGEPDDEFFARLLAASGPPTPEEADRLRQLLPLPIGTTQTADAA